MKYIDLAAYNLPPFRQKQVDQAVFHDLVSSISQISTLPLDLRERLARAVHFPAISVLKSISSKDGSYTKVLFRCADSLTFESVLLRHKDKRNTVCISTQIGCPMGCKFCATGQMKFKRNLNHQEIVDQVLYFARELNKQKTKITNVVFMGMGEPLLNAENVERAVSILTDPQQFGLSDRKITLSTVGIIEPMIHFFDRFPQVNLAVSLHCVDSSLRSSIMPGASRTSLEDIAKFIRKHTDRTHRRVSLEYTLMDNINDKEQDADKLSQFVDTLGKYSRKYIHLNIIPYNPIGNSSFKPSSSTNRFLNYVKRTGINATLRTSLGKEDHAGCGMLKSSSE